MERRVLLETWVGVFVAAGLAALAMLAFRVGDISQVGVSNPYRIAARFDNIGGLTERSAVTMAGVRVGRVADISFDSDRYQAVVTMQIDGRYDRIPVDSSAAIFTSGLLGEQYIGLEPGGADEYLTDGDVLRYSQSALVLEKLIAQFLYSMTEDKKPAAPAPLPQ